MAIQRIRWESARGCKSILGYAGSHQPWMFQIWTGGDEARWQLLAQLPGYDMRPEHADPEHLKAEAEELLSQFVASLGANFPED